MPIDQSNTTLIPNDKAIHSNILVCHCDVAVDISFDGYATMAHLK